LRALPLPRWAVPAAWALSLAGAPTPGRAAETLVIGQTGDTITLDPHAFNGIVEARVMSNLFDALVTFDKSMEI
jgi:ABC-type transport system substrate-binding protein